MHVGHLVNFLFGGSDEPSNLVLICGPCNQSMPMFGPGRREAAILWVASTPTAEDIAMVRTQRLMMLVAGHLDSVAGLAEALCEANPPLESLTALTFASGIVVELPSPDDVEGADEDGEDPLDPLGLFARAQLQAPAIIEALSVVDRAHTRVKAKARAERQKGGRPHFGMRAEGKELVEIEEELATIKRIVELRVAGNTFRRIAEMLEAEGRTAKGGGRWHPESVRRVYVRRDGV